MIEGKITTTSLLISRRDVDVLARPCIADDREAERYIEEAEKVDLLPNIGTKLYLLIKNDPSKYDILLNGGVWQADSSSASHICAGLRTTLAYYAYARIVRNGGHIASRFGFTEKRDDFSSAVELKQRVAEANDAYSVAVEHLKSCLAYARAKGLLGCGEQPINTFRPKYRVIKT